MTCWIQTPKMWNTFSVLCENNNCYQLITVGLAVTTTQLTFTHSHTQSYPGDCHLSQLIMRGNQAHTDTQWPIGFSIVLKDTLKCYIGVGDRTTDPPISVSCLLLMYSNLDEKVSRPMKGRHRKHWRQSRWATSTMQHLASLEVLNRTFPILLDYFNTWIFELTFLHIHSTFKAFVEPKVETKEGVPNPFLNHDLKITPTENKWQNVSFWFPFSASPSRVSIAVGGYKASPKLSQTIRGLKGLKKDSL